MARDHDATAIDLDSDPAVLDLSTDSRPPERTFIGKTFRWIYDNKSTLVVLYILLVSEAVRGVTIPSQSQYVKNAGGDSSFLGLTVGAFSGGRLAMTVLVGVLGGILSYRKIFVGTGILLILSNILYAVAGISKSKWLIFVARIGLGLGAGTLGTVRAYFAEAYDQEHRTTALAVAAAVQYAGFALFPGVGDLIAYICSKNNWNYAMFDEYTAPAWLMIAMSALSLFMLMWSFHEPEHKKFELRDLIPIYKPFIYKQAGVVSQSIRKAFGLQTSADVERERRLSIHFDPNAPGSFELQTISTTTEDGHKVDENGVRLPQDSNARGYGKEDADNFLSSSTDDEHPSNTNGHATLDTVLESDLEDLQSNEDVESGSSSPKDPTSKRTQRLITYIWIAFLVLNFLIRVALGTVEVLGSQLYDGVTHKYITPPDTEYKPSSGTYYMILGIIGTGVTLVFAFFAKRIDDQFPFFLSLGSLFIGSLTLIGQLSTMSLARFTFALGLIYSIGYPLAQSVVVSMFSKISASQRSQAVSMSWIGSIGSVGRILGPIAVGAIYQKGGAPTTFIFNTAITALTLALAIVTVYFMRKIK